MIGKKISTKMYRRGIEHWWKKHSLAGRRTIKRFHSLKNGSEKSSRAAGSQARLSQTQNWSI